MDISDLYRIMCEEGVLTDNDFMWEICSQCHGDGTSSAYLGSFTQSEIDEQGDDFREDYMAGHYDRWCDVCGGSGKVRELTDSARARPEVDEWIRSHYETEAIYASERRMGA